MGLSRSRLCRETFAAAIRFHARGLWKQYPDDHCMALRVPGEKHPLFASILGNAGQAYGLALTRGERALDSLLFILGYGPAHVDVDEDGSHLSFTMTPLREIPPEHRKFLRKARFAGRRESEVPFFMSKEAGKLAREIDPHEAEIFLYALNGILKAFEAGVLDAGPIQHAEEILTLTISGDPLDPDVTAESLRYDAAPSSPVEPLADVPRELSALPRLSATWLVGFPVMPTWIADDEREIRALLVVDESSQAILCAEAMPAGNEAEAAAFLFAVFQGDNSQNTTGVPSAMVFASRKLFELLSVPLENLGVSCSHEPIIPALSDIATDLSEYLSDMERELAEI